MIATEIIHNASNENHIKEIAEVAELDGIINTYVNGRDLICIDTYKHIQEKFWAALDAIQGRFIKRQELFENALDKSTEHLMKTQEEREDWKQKYSQLQEHL